MRSRQPRDFEYPSEIVGNEVGLLAVIVIKIVRTPLKGVQVQEARCQVRVLDTF